MADAVVSAAVRWIGSLLIQEASTLFKVVNQVRELQKELELMQEYLVDAHAKQEEGELRVLMHQIRGLAFDVEDVIDTYILITPSPTEKHRLKRFGHYLYKAPGLYKLGKRLQVMQNDVLQMTKKLDSLGLRRIAPELQEGFRKLHWERYGRARPPSYPFKDKSNEYIVGLEEDLPKLLEKLLSEENTHLHFFAIVGMGGSGKTTLARELYNNPFVKECFDCMAWVSVSQEWSIQHILSEILRMVSDDVGFNEWRNKLSAEELVDKLRNILKEKTFFIVIDDVWSREALELILPALPLGDLNRRNKIIITTRNQEVVQFQNLRHHLYIHKPPPLSDQEGWELLSKLALGHRTDCDVESYKALGNIMQKNCGGLPLAIVALAGILKSRSTIGEWHHLNEAIRSRVMKGLCYNTLGSVEYMLALSYEDLPSEQKPCFLYLGLFPEDCQIPTGILTRMWIAEGLVTAQEEISPEDVALQYLEELSHRCMIQVVRTNYMGAIKKIFLHDLLRDLSIKKAKEQSFLQLYRNNNNKNNNNDNQASNSSTIMHNSLRRAALHRSIKLPTQDSKLRSLVLLTRSSLSLSAYVQKETIDLRIVHENFKLLRLLNLWGIRTSNGTLPKEIGSLIHLRYLGIRASNIMELPWSIGNLRNLLTLDYRNIDSDYDAQVKIPNVLWKLVLLRHLFLPMEWEWSSLDEFDLKDLRNVRILWGLKSSRGANWFSREMAELSATVKKLKVFLSSEMDLEATFSCPSFTKHELHTLHCQLADGLTLRQVNTNFSHNQLLTKLVLIGKLNVEKLSLILPPNLVILEMKDNVVKDEDPMLAIGKLTHLKFLRLSNSYVGTTLICKIGSFRMLEEINLDNLHNLEKWVIGSKAMSNLKKIHIINCQKLNHLPKGLECVSTLQLFEYVEVPIEFVREARECGWLRKELHNLDVIIEQADIPIDVSPASELYEKLKAGVFLKNKEQMYWIVKQNGHYCNCFLWYATSILLNMSVASVPVALWYEVHRSAETESWNEINAYESDGTTIKVLVTEVNKLLQGTFFSNNLSPHHTYEVMQVIMVPKKKKRSMVQQRCGSSRLLHSSGRLQLHDLMLGDEPKGKWIQLPIGEFKTPPHSSGERIEFQLRYTEPGLLVKGVIFQPKL